MISSSLKRLIRAECLKGNSKEIKKLLLNDQQRLAVMHAGAPLRSARLAKLQNISVPSAHSRLVKLRQSGYLTSRKLQQRSGGYEWVYTINKKEVTGEHNGRD